MIDFILTQVFLLVGAAAGNAWSDRYMLDNKNKIDFRILIMAQSIVLAVIYFAYWLNAMIYFFPQLNPNYHLAGPLFGIALSVGISIRWSTVTPERRVILWFLVYRALIIIAITTLSWYQHAILLNHHA
jgi:hypothetical protein